MDTKRGAMAYASEPPTLTVFTKWTFLFTYYIHYLFLYFLWQASGICILGAFKLLATFHPFENSTNVTQKLLQKAEEKKNIFSQQPW